MAQHKDNTGPKDLDSQTLDDIRAVNEQLLIASLREQELAEEVRRQLAFTTAVTTSLAEGVLVLDVAGQCTFVNSAAEHILGWTSDTLCGQHSSVVIPTHAVRGVSGATDPAPLHAVLSLGASERVEDAQFMHRDGHLLPTAYSAAPMIMEEAIVGAVITFRDLTEIRHLQRTREEYLALISHDLRAPLTVIYGRAQLLVRQLAQHGLGRETESAKILVESSRRLTQMLEALIDRSHTEAIMEARNRTTIDLVALVQHMIDFSILPDNRAQVIYEPVPRLAVVIEEEGIERVVVNLLTNALKFSPRGQPILVRVNQHGNDAIIVVVDQGIGIAPEDLSHLFEKHYRAQAVGQIAGSGLGLYGSRLIVEAHGGRLWAESVLGVGSTFTVALPLPL
jgi:PAS domain S-box-containing protein